MIILRLNGGLGNQMFQYAFCRSLADKYHQQIYMDFSAFKNSNRTYSLDMFPLNSNLICDLDDLVDIHNYQIFSLQEDGFRFNTEALNAFDGYDLDNSLFLISGYWQSSQYFQNISGTILNDFKNTYEIDLSYRDIRQFILSSESVMVHVRRGDYLWERNLNKHGIVGIDYINKGMSHYRRKIKKAKFFIFSDDPLWCKSNIGQSDDVIFINKDSDEGKTSFTLMRECKYFLLSNSTYSWWAAWLSEFPEKQVICPMDWFRENNTESIDLIPSDWMKY